MFTEVHACVHVEVNGGHQESSALSTLSFETGLLRT